MSKRNGKGALKWLRTINWWKWIEEVLDVWLKKSFGKIYKKGGGVE